MARQQLGGILSELPRIRDTVREHVDTLLANLAMIGEIPAPTFGEADRIHLLQQRFSECGLQNVSTDEVSNGLGILPGAEGETNILVVAHADTVFPDTVDHNITFHRDRVVGPGAGDNSLGVAVLASLPTLLEHLGIQLNANLILMGGSRSLGRGDLEGLSFFLSNNTLPIKAGVCVEGMELGRLAFTSIGMLRGEITCSVAEEEITSQSGNTSAILVMNDVINEIARIRLPRKPRSNIFFGSIEGGTSFKQVATRAVLRFEIHSEARDIVRDVRQQVRDIAAEVSSHTRAEVKLDVFGRRRPGGLAFTHPLPSVARRIQRKLSVEPKIRPSTSELSAFIARKVPAITLGITAGQRLNEEDETVFIEPMFRGIAQLIGVLLAIDRGFCDEH